MVMMTDSVPQGEADVARIAALIGDRTRARVLMTLTDGRALTACALAAEAGVSPSTISEHVARLCEASLLAAERQGRARYFRLRDPAVAEALEAIARISPPEPVRSLRQGTRAHALRRARTCYHHLAGRLGVTLMEALLERGIVTGGDGHHHPDSSMRDRLAAPGSDRSYQLTQAGHRELAAFGLDLGAVLSHRPTIRYCVDWSEQRHHLAGPLGAALTSRLFELGWIRRTSQHRVVLLSDSGQRGLEETFGLPPDWEGQPGPAQS